MYQRMLTIIALSALVFLPAAMAQVQQDEIIGTLRAKTDSTLTIETDKGQTATFSIEEATILPETLSVGDRISVHHRAGAGDESPQPIIEVLIADDTDIMEANTMESGTMESETMESNTMQSETTMQSEAMESKATMDSPMEASTLQSDSMESEMESDTTGSSVPSDADVLPQTASPLASLLLIGLAALGGAAGLRHARS